MPLLAGIFPSLSPMNREYADLGRALINRYGLEEIAF